MKVTQVYQLLNTTTQEVLGESVVVAEDLTNVVDVGVAVFDANAVDNFVKSLVDHIGKMVFVDRVYQGAAPSVLMDGWEYGAVLQKVSLSKLPEAEENESWGLVDGQSYDVNVFYGTSVENKFFSKRVTFEIPISIAEKQVKSAFNTAQQMNSFMSMIYTGIENSMTLKLESLITRTINNMIAMTIQGAKATNAINLLALYNASHTEQLTAAQSVTNPDFLRFASYHIALTKSRMSRMSTLFNVGGKERFTPADRLHIVMLSEFSEGANVYLQSDVYHNEFTSLPNGIEKVPYWQGSGTDYGFASTSKINVTTAGGTVEQSGILAVMFDRDALGVANMDRRVTTNWNAKAEFWNNYYKYDAGYFNDTNENFVLFYVADANEASVNALDGTTMAKARARK